MGKELIGFAAWRNFFMKKFGVALVAVLWLLAGVQIVRSGEPGGRERIMEVLGKVGTMEQHCIVDYYGVLDESVEDEQAFLLEAARALGLEEELIENADREAFGEKQIINTETGTFQLITKEEGQGQGQYFLAEISFEEEPEETFARRAALDKAMREYMRASRSSVNVVGYYSGKLTLEERNQAADELLERMDARVVSENRTMELYTIYGYTPYIAEYQLQEGNAVNVNIAMHYNAEEDRTYIYAAVPVISVEY